MTVFWLNWKYAEFRGKFAPMSHDAVWDVDQLENSGRVATGGQERMRHGYRVDQGNRM